MNDIPKPIATFDSSWTPKRLSFERQDDGETMMELELHCDGKTSILRFGLVKPLLASDLFDGLDRIEIFRGMLVDKSAGYEIAYRTNGDWSCFDAYNAAVDGASLSP